MGRAILVISLLFSALWHTSAQEPFDCANQRWVIQEDGRFGRIDISPSSGAMVFVPLVDDLGIDTRAIAFRSQDRLMYALATDGSALYRYGRSGTVQTLKIDPVSTNYQYEAGGITPDGQYFLVVASTAGRDQRYFWIDLSDPDYSAREEISPNGVFLQDLAFGESQTTFLGYDALDRSIVEINTASMQMTRSPFIEFDDDMQGAYFDAFGEFFTMGTVVNGVAGALFLYDRTNGQYSRSNTGPPILIKDMASCPNSVDLRLRAQTKVAIPCTEIEYAFEMVNNSGQSISNLSLVLDLPEGISYIRTLSNALVGTDISTPTSFALRSMTLPPGEHTVTILLETDNVSARELDLQALLSGLPNILGDDRLSDDPTTRRGTDATVLNLESPDQEDVTITSLLCEGDVLELDGSPYGSIVRWNTGQTTPKITVSEAGTYVMDAGNACTDLLITFVVTLASCPFTIEMAEEVLPDSVLPCSEIRIRYTLENGSGDERLQLSISDTLPDGFTFVKMLDSGLEYDLGSADGDQSIEIRNLTLPEGIDTLSAIVYVDDIEPGTYGVRSRLWNIPQELGPFRLSDDPRTSGFDSTAIYVLGTESDSIVVRDSMCMGEPKYLDGSPYGVDFLWQDGSTDSRLSISGPGRYELIVFSGCEESYISFIIDWYPGVSLSPDRVVDTIRLGEELDLELEALSQTDSLSWSWSDPVDTSLSCTTCAVPSARPLRSISYLAKINNEYCRDSSVYELVIDNSRRIYAPNVFSPNGDGINDLFQLYTSEFAWLIGLELRDRWGNIVYRCAKTRLDIEPCTWDGTVKMQGASESVYAWSARIRFLDGLEENFFGDVLILR